MTKLFSKMLLVLSFCLFWCVAETAAEIFTCAGNGYELTYEINDDGNSVTVVNASTDAGSLSQIPNATVNIVIPDYVTYNGKEYAVTTIGAGTFEHYNDHPNPEVYVHLVIGKNVTSIGKNAFQHFSHKVKSKRSYVFFMGSVAPEMNKSAFEKTQNTTFYFLSEEIIESLGNDITKIFTSKGNEVLAGIPSDIRTFPDHWVTLCVPSSLDEETIALLWGSGTEVAQLTSASYNSTNKTYELYFTKATGICANSPYLIKAGNKDAVVIMTDLGDRNVNIPETQSVNVNGADRDVTASMTGVYEDICNIGGGNVFLSYNKTSQNYYFVTVSEGSSCYVAPYKCFFSLRDINGNVLSARMGMRAKDSELTSIPKVTEQGYGSTNTIIFDTSGRKVNTDIKALSNGIYIINGKKVLVK